MTYFNHDTDIHLDNLLYDKAGNCNVCLFQLSQYNDSFIFIL